jgi:hypothetical protein
MSYEERETVVLVLKDVVYRHAEFRSLEEFLADKYGFSKIVEKEHETSESRETFPTGHAQVAFEKEEMVSIAERIEKRFSFMKIYKGVYLGSEIEIYFLGKVTQEEDLIVGASLQDQYPIYTAGYQMIKLIGGSGYAIQHFIERLTTDLGLRINLKEWFFHRGRRNLTSTDQVK